MNRKLLTCYSLLHAQESTIFQVPWGNNEHRKLLWNVTCAISSGVSKPKMQEWNYFEDCNYTTVANSFYIPTEQALNIHLDLGIQPSLGSLCKVRILILTQNQLVVNANFKRYSVIWREVPGCKSLCFLRFKRFD